MNWNTNGYTIVSGGANGVDSSAEKFAEKHDIETKILEPDWDDWNQQIVHHSDAIVAVWDGALDDGTSIYVEVYP